METSRIAPGVLDTLRLDAEFYGREFLRIERHIRAAPGTTQRLGELVTELRDGPGGWGVSTNDYLDEGVPVVRTVNIRDMTVDLSDCVFISDAKHAELIAHEIVAGDVLLSVRGTIGRAAVFRVEAYPKASMNAAVVRMRPKPSLDGDYLVAFFNCYHGTKQSERIGNGAVQQNMNLTETRSHWIPVPNPHAQRYIGDKVRQAERLRKRALQLDTLTFAAFEPLTQGLPSPQRAFRVPSSEVEAYRLNPNHFDPVVRAAIHAAKAVARLHPLSDLVVDGNIAGGATPLGAHYVADGIFFARVQNVKPLRLDRSDAAFISAEQDREIARSRCRTDDVVLSITGYPGTASVVLDEDLPLNINQHSVRFAVRSEFGAGYVAAAINSRFGQLQVGRLAVGGTRDALDYTSVRSLLIPDFSSEIREAINAQVLAANLCVRAAKRLVVLAQRLVEYLIDGRLAETDLVAAQTAIEAGDRRADRELLKSLRESDAPDAKPLIADVDALYALLDGPEGQDA